MTFLSLPPSIDIAKCKVSMLKLLKLYLYLLRRRQMPQFYFGNLQKLQNKGKTEELET